MIIAPRNEPRHEITLTQLREQLEFVEAGDLEPVKEWYRAAIAFCEGGDWPEEIRELRCQRCSSDYPVWFAPHELWNAVVKEGEHFFCPTCFAVLAEERGKIPTAWKLTIEE